MSDRREHLRRGVAGPRRRLDDGPMTDLSPIDAHRRTFWLGDTFCGAVLTTGDETAGRHDITDGVMAAGSSTPLHLHTRYDERFFVVAGSLTIWAGSDRVTLGPGDFYAIPANTPHVIEAGPDGARALNISSPAAFAELVMRAGTPVGDVSPEVAAERFAAISAELGDEIIGPPGALPS
jgi:mannose-6-phosphate isomerase-like protein (cupin superfamily)